MKRLCDAALNWDYWMQREFGIMEHRTEESFKKLWDLRELVNLHKDLAQKGGSSWYFRSSGKTPIFLDCFLPHEQLGLGDMILHHQNSSIQLYNPEGLFPGGVFSFPMFPLFYFINTFSARFVLTFTRQDIESLTFHHGDPSNFAWYDDPRMPNIRFRAIFDADFRPLKTVLQSLIFEKEIAYVRCSMIEKKENIITFYAWQ